MLRLKKIAITGGLGSGKTTACQFFKELGAYVVHTDAIVHALLDPHTQLGKQVVALFGPKIVSRGEISRAALAEEVFSSPEKLKALESLLHPAVLRRVEELYKEASIKGEYTSFVVEVPLLFEAGWDLFYDITIAIKTEAQLAKKRCIESGFPADTYEKRMARQMAPSEKEKRAQVLFINNGSKEDLRRQVALFYSTL